MAKINQGILGGFRGAIANVVGSSWKGISVMKSKPVSVANPRTASQVTQRTAFANTVAYAQSILASIIKPLWDRFSVKMSGFNDFVSTNIGFFDGEYPSDPSKIIISKGKMDSTPITAVTTSDGSKTVKVDWTNDAGQGFKLASDIAYILCIRNGMLDELKVKADVIRSAGTATLSFAENNSSADIIDCYLAFKRADGTVVSNTSYFEETV